MKLYIILACLTAMVSMVQSTFVVAVTGLSTATTASLASGAALILGAKLLALKGVLIGRALRGKRETLEEIFLEASKKDQYDCRPWIGAWRTCKRYGKCGNRGRGCIRSGSDLDGWPERDDARPLPEVEELLASSARPFIRGLA